MDNVTKNIKKKKRDINSLILTTDKSDLDEYLELSRKIHNKRIDLNKVVLDRINRILPKMGMGDNMGDIVEELYIAKMMSCYSKKIDYSEHIILIRFGDRFGDIFYDIEVTSDILWSDDFKIDRISNF